MSLSAVAIMILVYLGKDIILNQVFGHITAEVKGHADIYLLIVTASIPFIALYNGGAAIFRAMGNSQVSMRVSLLMNAINVTGNAILVFGLRIGTAGVAIPTLISRMVAAIVITVLLCNQTRIFSKVNQYHDRNRTRLTNHTSCVAALHADFSSFLPIYCPATTAPPVASAAKILMIRIIILSTSDTPDTAASPDQPISCR